MENGNVELTFQLFVGAVLVIITVVTGIVKIIEYFSNKASNKEKKEMKEVENSNKQDLKIHELDIRLTSVEHNMGKLEGIIMGMDNRLNSGLSDISTKVDDTTRQIINLLNNKTNEKHERL